MAVVTDAERELELAERSVRRLSAAEYRWRDRFARWFERSMLLVLVVLYFLGFQTQQQNTDAIQASRAEGARETCIRLNRNAAAANRNTAYIVGLIVTGAKQSKPFEPLYRRYGFPPYKVRLAAANKTAAALSALRVPILNCKVAGERVKDTLPH